MTATTAFARIFGLITETVQFNEAWNNNTGYLDNAVHDKTIPEGQIVKSTSAKGRNILIIGAPKGNVVIFERYSNQKGIIVSNAPYAITQAFDLHSNLSDEKVLSLFGINESVEYFFGMSDEHVLSTIDQHHLGNVLISLANHFS